jgi:hypothetical protein
MRSRALVGGRVRRSTVVLAVAFLAVFALYVEVRPAPDPADGGDQDGRPAYFREAPRPHRGIARRPGATPQPEWSTPAPTPGVSADPSAATPIPVPEPVPAVPRASSAAPLATPTPTGLLSFLPMTPNTPPLSPSPARRSR